MRGSINTVVAFIISSIILLLFHTPFGFMFPVVVEFPHVVVALLTISCCFLIGDITSRPFIVDQPFVSSQKYFVWEKRIGLCRVKVLQYNNLKAEPYTASCRYRISEWSSSPSICRNGTNHPSGMHSHFGRPRIGLDTRRTMSRMMTKTKKPYSSTHNMLF